MKSLIAAALLALAVPLAAQTQEPPRFGENVEVNVVLLDAIVTDAKGNQILGLGPDDFVVRENGVVQKIESVDYYTNRQLLTSPEGKAPFKVERIREERYFVLFFDKPNFDAFSDTPAETGLWTVLVRATRDARDFIEQRMLPGDRVAIVGHDVRLKVYSDFTSDKAQLSRALNEAVRFGNGISQAPAGSDPSILRALDHDEMIGHTGTVYQALETLGDALRPIKARKNVILFSAGIYESGETVRNGLPLTESRYYQPMIQSLNAANVTVDAISLLPYPDETPIFHHTLARIARETNGEYYRHAVNFGGLLRRIERQNNGYYLITYTAKHPRGTHGFQKVDVTVKEPSLRIKAREGYVYGAGAY
jgi:VWFA-related protein